MLGMGGASCQRKTGFIICIKTEERWIIPLQEMSFPEQTEWS